MILILTGPAFLTASSSPYASWEPLKPTTFGVSHINFITEMFFYLHGQDISRAGVKLLPPGEGPEGEFRKQDGQSMMDEPKEQGKENLWSFYFAINFNLNQRSSNVCLTCIGQFFATLSLIYWPACLIIVCMYLNKHKGHSKKKIKIFCVFVHFTYLS